MRIYEDGVYRDATIEELAEMQVIERRERIKEASRPLTLEEVQRLALRRQVNSLDIDEATASRMVDFYPEMTDFAAGGLIAAKTVISWRGALKRAAVDLWNAAENSPDNAPALWEDIAYKDGIRIIPATITAGQAFAKGECGWWNDAVYESVIEANTYTPAQYPAGWELVR